MAYKHEVSEVEILLANQLANKEITLADMARELSLVSPVVYIRLARALLEILRAHKSECVLDKE